MLMMMIMMFVIIVVVVAIIAVPPEPTMTFHIQSTEKPGRLLQRTSGLVLEGGRHLTTYFAGLAFTTDHLPLVISCVASAKVVLQRHTPEQQLNC